jgi:phage tail-like protein
MFGRRKILVAAAVLGLPLLGLVAAPTLVGAVISEPEPVTLVSLTIDGHELGRFSRCVGLGSESEVINSTTGGEEEVILKRLPGPTSGRTVCERAITRNIELAAWRELVVLGDIAAARKSVSITMYSAKGEPQFREFVQRVSV